MPLKIKSQRVLRKLTQKDVADYLDISQSAYAMKENGQTPFTVDEAKKLLELFEMKFEELF